MEDTMTSYEKRLQTKLRTLIQEVDEAGRKPAFDETNKATYQMARLNLVLFILQYQDRIGIVPQDAAVEARR
jgi:hypothetical protein